jgi:hypothetical protein
VRVSPRRPALLNTPPPLDDLRPWPPSKARTSCFGKPYRTPNPKNSSPVSSPHPNPKFHSSTLPATTWLAASSPPLVHCSLTFVGVPSPATPSSSWWGRAPRPTIAPPCLMKKKAGCHPPS